MTILEDYQEHPDPSACVKALGIGLWDYDIDADHLSCDSHWYSIVGIDEHASRVRCIGDFIPYIFHEDVTRATAIDPAEVSALIESDVRYYNEFRIVRPSGEVRLLRSVACVLIDALTDHRRAMGCITDLTAFNEFEQAPARWPMSLVSQWPPREERDETPDQTGGPVTLSEKEKACLLWVSYGKTAEETALIVGRSRRTVEFHISNAVRKLGATNKVHAAVTAIRMGIL